MDCDTPIGQMPEKPLNEARRHRRFRFVSPVFVRVLVEEQTFTPLQFNGKSIDLSSGGMMVRVEELDRERYQLLIRGRRMVRINMKITERRRDGALWTHRLVRLSGTALPFRHQL